MFSRRYTPILAALGLLAACTPDVKQHGNPATVTYAAFDPTATPPAIPLPNDLARANAASTTGAQQELLFAFNQAGGFSNDQELAVTIDLFTEAVTTAPRARTAPDLDLTTLKVVPAVGATVAVFQVAQNCPTGADAAAGQTCQPMTPVPVPISTPTYAKFADHGTLSIYPAPNLPGSVGYVPGATTGARRWPAGGKFVVALRGSDNGIKTTDGTVFQPQAAMWLLLQDKDLSLPANQALLEQQYPDPAVAAAFGAQLEAVRQQLLPAFGLLDQAGLPHRELADITAFTVAPATGAVVLADPTAGQMPLPSDFLIDPATAKVVNNPAFCAGQVDPNTGTCATAQGIATLDGFSTTAMILAQTSGPIQAASVNGRSVMLFDLTTPSSPKQLYDVGAELASSGAVKAAYLSEPPPITQDLSTGQPCAPGATGYASTCVSQAIGLQPAIPDPTAGTPFDIGHSLPPLKETTEYLVVVTNQVKDAAGNPLAPSTLAKILQFQSPLAANGKSQLAGVSDVQAAQLEQMRTLTQSSLAAAGIGLSSVAMAYTFKTQGISQTALQLAAVPYSSSVAPLMVPGAITPGAMPAGYPSTGIAEVFSATVPTLDPIDPSTGALNPDSSKWTPTALNAYVVVPAIPGASSCASNPAQCARLPLVVFQHGLGRNKSDVFAIASALSQAGFVTVAIDAPLHGERASCAVAADCLCPAPSSGGQPVPGGTGSCTATCSPPTGATSINAVYPNGVCSAGSTPVSGKYFVSANFFATRDALREDLLDESALVASLAPLSAGAANPVSTELANNGVALDPSKVYWVGQSLGGILGTLNTAANPRFSKAVLNVPGGTLVDVFTQSPSFQTQVAAIFQSLNVPVGSPQYLQALQLAKWILDGGDPINFAGHITADTWPNPLASGAAQPAKAVYGQYAICDQVILNPFEGFLLEQAGAAKGSAADPLTIFTVSGAGSPGACTSPLSNPAHGFLLNFADVTATTEAQSDAAKWLAGALAPPPTYP